MWFGKGKKLTLPSASEALPGRSQPVYSVPHAHYVNGHDLTSNRPQDAETVLFGLGCFWGAERKFWQHPNVWVTSVGYAGGQTPHPTYEEVCTGRTGHNEVVEVVYRGGGEAFDDLLRLFWESHDPTQGMRQGNDIGTQYRSGIYVTSQDQRMAAVASRDRYQRELNRQNRGQITTEILDAPQLYRAEDYHQQYLAKNPMGYCGLGGTGVAYPAEMAGAK